jgi:dethiobiotin synthetase
MLIVIAGTGTDVGKTWVACQLARELRRRSFVVSARKPAQSFSAADTASGATDADLLARATGEQATDVCPPSRWYPKAMAPPMAAESMGSAPFGLDDLLSQLSWPVDADVGLVEQAGGIGSPQASDGDGVDMVDKLGPDCVVLVAGAGLGTLSNIGLAARALGRRRLVVYLSRFDPGDDLHVANRRWLAEHRSMAVVIEPVQLAHALVNPRPDAGSCAGPKA